VGRKASQFNFKIILRPGKQGGKPDALSRRLDYTLGKDVEERGLTFLKPEHIDLSLLEEEELSQLQTYSLSSSQVSLGTNRRRTDAIRKGVEEDPTVCHYLPYL